MPSTSHISTQNEALIDTVFARCIRNNNRVKIFFLSFAALCLIGGAGFSINDKEHLRIPGMISTLLCFLIFGGFGFYLLLKPAEERFANIKAKLRNQPQELTWSYILEQRTNGIPSWFVVMCFRGGEQLHIHRNSFPGKDMEGFMRVLAQINPRMHIGYSEELKKMYKRGEL